MVIIKIDTKKDSKEDIKKTIGFLKQFTDEFEKSAGNDQIIPDTAFNMFSNDDNNSNKDENDEQKEDHDEDIDDEELNIKPMFY